MAEFTDLFGAGWVEVSPEDVVKCTEAFKKSGATGCYEYFKSKREEWKTIPLNVAVIGLSGNGKSTFINTMRGLKAKDAGAAAVGVNETTNDIRAYSHPNNEKLVFWDLPGVGTENFPKGSYLERIEFDKYDCYIIMTATRFLEMDAWLGEEIQKTKKGFFYVRTKIGIDMRNDKYENGKDHDVNKLTQDIRNATMAEVKKKLKFEAPLFLIDSHQRNKYDFDQFEIRIIDDLPKLKRHAMALSLSAFSKSMIKAKVGELRRRAWYMAILSAGVAAVPVPGLSIAIDFAILLEEATFYYYQLGLDEASLRKRAKFFAVQFEPLQNTVLKHFPSEITLQLIRSIAVGSVYIVGSASEEFLRFLPFVGSLIASALSLAVTRYTLGCILDKMQAVALEIADFTEQLPNPNDEPNPNNYDDDINTNTVG